MRALIFAVALAACGPAHVQLAPTSQLSPDQRVARFYALRPIKEGTLSENGDQVDKWLVLADKTEIGYPEDLAPVLDENTETMRVARQSVAMRHRKEISGTIGTVLLVGSLVFSGFLSDSLQVGPAPWTGLTLLGTGLIAGIFARHYGSEEIDLRRKAFSTYPRDLGAKLNVCAHGLQVVACEIPLPGAAPVAAPFPAAPPIAAPPPTQP